MRIILSSPDPDLDAPPSPVILCSILRIRSWSLLTRSFKPVMSSNVGAIVYCDYEWRRGGYGIVVSEKKTKKTTANHNDWEEDEG